MQRNSLGIRQERGLAYLRSVLQCLEQDETLFLITEHKKY